MGLVAFYATMSSQVAAKAGLRSKGVDLLPYLAPSFPLLPLAPLFPLLPPKFVGGA